jgi:hypothetical protein
MIQTVVTLAMIAALFFLMNKVMQLESNINGNSYEDNAFKNAYKQDNDKIGNALHLLETMNYNRDSPFFMIPDKVNVIAAFLARKFPDFR